MEFFDIGLFLSLIVFGLGVLWRMVKWLKIPRGNTTAPAKNILVRLLLLLRTLLLEIFLLFRTGRTGIVRWVAHTLVFFGFMGLLLFHAMDGIITVHFFPEYESTLQPWQTLRNAFGLMTIMGVVIMVIRRCVNRKLRKISRIQDWALLVVVGGIILSGFFLEATKIISPAVFTRMTDEYFVFDEEDEMIALKAFWSKEYGVVFSEELPVDSETLQQGFALNEESCSFCHADTATAFVSRPLATALTPVAGAMNRNRADEIFWYMHIVLCFLGTAVMPFGKFFHPVATPANLIVRQGARTGEGNSSCTARGLALDACTRCGECSLHCSVAPSFSVLGNVDILPSEKLISLKQFWLKKDLEHEKLAAFAQGSRICTECMRCTDICPSGINLQELWMGSKPEIATLVPESNHALRKMSAEERFDSFVENNTTHTATGLADNAESFWACVQCTTCTNVCPVVAVCEEPSQDLDLMPQQIMNLLRMGLKEEAMGVRMVWSCTTCYKCQEHCPQNIRVADVLFELRNAAAARLDSADSYNKSNEGGEG
ncbi:MAG: 4Fe-4S dicluster domain-containing protein [Desulfovibrio sp.]